MREIDHADENGNLLRALNSIRTFNALPDNDIRSLIKLSKFRVYEPG